MRTSPEAIEFIKRFEGYRSKAYKPTANDKLTIGWGHTHGVYEGMEIDKHQAEKFLEFDIKQAEQAILRNVRVPLSTGQFDALVSFVFNIGEPRFATSTLVKELNKGHYHNVPHQLSLWKKQSGVVLSGLVRRRAAEAEIWLGADNDLYGAVQPDVPRGRNLRELANKSKTVQIGGATAALGMADLASKASEANSLISQVTQMLPDISASWVLLGVGLFFIYNRYRDSRLGRAY